MSLLSWSTHSLGRRSRMCLEWLVRERYFLGRYFMLFDTHVHIWTQITQYTRTHHITHVHAHTSHYTHTHTPHYTHAHNKHAPHYTHTHTHTHTHTTLHTRHTHIHTHQGGLCMLRYQLTEMGNLKAWPLFSSSNPQKQSMLSVSSTLTYIAAAQ